MDTSNYEKMLYKLFLKGMIDEKTLEEKMNEKNRKEFGEIKVEEYVKEAIKRICSERFQKEQ